MAPCPPELHVDAEYTACYCEENVYLLARRLVADATLAATWDALVLVVSNCDKTVRAARSD
jgi:hypothetical protein